MNYFEDFIVNGEMGYIPYIKIPEKSTDRTIVWDKNNSRLDVLANIYYKNQFGDKLILLANAHLGLDEFLWADGVTVRIPYPFNESLNQYKDSVRKYKSLGW